MKGVRSISLAGAVLAMLGACSSPQPLSSEAAAYLSDARLGETVDELCFPNFIDGFREATDQTVIIEKADRDFLLQTERYCSQLANAQRLFVDDYIRTGCIYPDDILSAHTSNFTRDRYQTASVCHIKAIYEWDEDATDPQAAQLR